MLNLSSVMVIMVEYLVLSVMLYWDTLLLVSDRSFKNLNFQSLFSHRFQYFACTVHSLHTRMQLTALALVFCDAALMHASPLERRHQVFLNMK